MSDPPRLAVGSLGWRAGRAAAVAVVVLCAVIFLLGLVLWAQQDHLAPERWVLPETWSEADLRAAAGSAGIPIPTVTAFYMLLELIVASIGIAVALLLLRGEPTWFRIYVAVALSVWVTTGGAMAIVYTEAGAAWAGSLQGIGWMAVFPIAYLFPDGVFVPRWTRWALIGWASYLPFLVALNLLGYQTGPESLVEVAPVLALLATAVYAAVYRYRRVSTPQQRRQTRGLVAALTVWFAISFVSAMPPLRNVVRDETVTGLLASGTITLASYLACALIPASIAVAMLRHGLYDLDVWVNRALTYGFLTALLAAAYAVAAAIGGLVWGAQDLAGPLVATVVVAAMLHPLRLQVQRRVDRFVYGHSLEPKVLLDDLRRSRERILVAREDERRRLQRDLHDGLGPTLASLYQRVDAARSMVATDPGAADRLLADVGEHTRSVIGDIRGLVQALRPPELDQLGLVGSIEAAASRLDGLTVSVTGDVGPQPPVVETAAYRIAMEALTNAAWHSGGRTAHVALTEQRGSLVVTVVDDGQGIGDDAQAGTGLQSMRERADELGGTCEIVTLNGGGTRVRAVLPKGIPT